MILTVPRRTSCVQHHAHPFASTSFCGWPWSCWRAQLFYAVLQLTDAPLCILCALLSTTCAAVNGVERKSDCPVQPADSCVIPPFHGYSFVRILVQLAIEQTEEQASLRAYLLTHTSFLVTCSFVRILMQLVMSREGDIDNPYTVQPVYS